MRNRRRPRHPRRLRSVRVHLSRPHHLDALSFPVEGLSHAASVKELGLMETRASRPRARAKTNPVISNERAFCAIGQPALSELRAVAKRTRTETLRSRRE